MAPISLQADPDDLVSLATFVELWWADEAPPRRVDGSNDELAVFLDRKQAALRMLRGNRPAFPDPSGPSSSSQRWGRSRLYRLGDLMAWTARADGDDTVTAAALAERSALVSPLWHLGCSLDACAGEIGPRKCRHLAVAALTVLTVMGVKPAVTRLPARLRALLDAGADTRKHLAVSASWAEQQAPELTGVFEPLLEELPRRLPTAGRVLTAAAASVQAGSPPEALMELVLRRPEGPQRTQSSARTPASLTRLLVAAGDPRPGETVLDPAAGEGNLLLHAAEQTEGDLTLIGIEPDPPTWAIAKARSYLRGIAIDLRLERSLDGASALPEADLVLVDPPLKSRRDYHRWLSLGMHCCRPQGRAVVALPALSAEAGRREWRILGSEHAALFVKCTSRLRTDHGDALVLWGLQPEPEDRVLIVDATTLGDRSDTLIDVGTDEADQLQDLIGAWRDTSQVQQCPQLAAAAVARTDITERNGDLLGHDWLAASRPTDGDKAVTEALTLARQLELLVDGPVRPYIVDGNRRALKRLIQTLEGQSMVNEPRKQPRVRGNDLPGESPGRLGNENGPSVHTWKARDIRAAVRSSERFLIDQWIEDHRTIAFYGSSGSEYRVVTVSTDEEPASSYEDGDISFKLTAVFRPEHSEQ